MSMRIARDARDARAYYLDAVPKSDSFNKTNKN